MSSPSQSSQVNADNPWPGLEAFEENARAFFRGRDYEAESLLKRVLDVPVTVLYGRSGLGKTSLLRAGLFPLLRERNYLPIYVRFDVKASAAPLADQLHQSISQAIAAELPGEMLPGHDESVWEYLHRSDFELWSAQNYPVTPVIVLDQFEELFTLGERVPELVEKFRNDLGDLAENRIPVDLAARIDRDAALAGRYSLRSLKYKLLISLREDFLADLEGWRRLIPALSRSRMRLRPLGVDEAFDAVHTPAGPMMTAELAHRVVDIIAGSDLHRGYERALRPGAGAGESRGGVAVEPALLSLFCRELNEERKREGKKQFDVAMVEGAKTDILSNYYLSCVRDLPGRVADFIETELITEKGFRNSYPRDDAVPEHLTEDELTGLIRLRLLRIEDRYGTPRVELTHDVLTGVVREQRDRRRAEKEKAALAARAEQEQRELAEAAAEREAELREEKERQQADLEAAQKLAAVETRAKEQAQAYAATLAVRTRLLRIAVAVAAVVAVVAAGLGLGAWDNSQRARQQLWKTTVLNLTGHGQSPSAAQRLGGEYRTLQEVLAARVLAEDRKAEGVRPDAEDALFNAVVSRGELSRLDWVPGAEVTRFSPDRRHALAVNYRQCAIRVFDLANLGTPRPTVAPGGSWCMFNWSADAGRIVSRRGDADADAVQVWDSVTGSSVGKTIRTEQVNVRGIAISLDGRRIYTGGQDGSIASWNSDTGVRLGWTGKTDRAVMSTQLTGDQRLLISSEVADKGDGTEDWTMVIRDATTLAPVGQPIYAGSSVKVVAASFDGRRVLIGSKGVQVWDTGIGRQVLHGRTIAEAHFVDSVAISRDGRTVLTGGSTGVVQRWDADSGATLGEPISTGDRPVYFAEFDDAGRIDFSTTDGTLRVRQPDPDRFWPPGQDRDIISVAISPDGQRIATATVARPPAGRAILGPEVNRGPTAVTVRNVGTGEVVGKTMTIEGEAHQLAFSKDGSRLVSGASDGNVRIWNVGSGAPIGEVMHVMDVEKNTDGVWAVAMSPDGSTIVTGDNRGELRRWDARTQKPDPVPFGSHGDRVTGVAYSGDGQRLVSGSMDGTVKMWGGGGARQQIGEAIEADMPVLSVAISPDGTRVAAGMGQGHGSRDDRGAVRVWDVDGTLVGAPLTDPAESVRKVAFSPNGNWVLSGAYDGTVRVWSAILCKKGEKSCKAGQQLGDPIPTDQGSAALEVAFSPDGDRILFGTDSGAMQSRPGPDGLSEQLCAKLWTNMSREEWDTWISPEIDYKEVCPKLPVAEDEPLAAK